VKKLATHYAFGAPAGLAPSVPVVRLDTALLGATLAGALAFVGSAAVLGRSLPGLGLMPPEVSLASFMRSCVSASMWLRDGGTGFYLRAVPVLLSTVSAGLWGFALGARPSSRLRHLSGPRLLGARAATKAAQQAAEAECAGRPAFLELLPGLSIAKSRVTRAVWLLGSMGSGKTQILLHLVAQAFAKADAESQTRAMVLDVKGDFVEKFPSGKILSPWDARSMRWDIAADVRTTAAAATLARSLCPVNSEGSGNTFFPLAAQQLITGACCDLMSECGQRWTWQDMAVRLNAKREIFVERLREHYPKAAALLETEGQTTASILATLATYTQAIDSLAEAWTVRNDEGRRRETFSLTRWVHGTTSKRAVIVCAGPDQNLTRAYIGALVEMAASMIVSSSLPDDEHGRSLFLFLDELPSLGRLQGLQPLLTLGRSKGCCMVMAAQSRELISEAYGENVGDTMLSVAGTQVVLRMQASQGRDRIAEDFGKARVAVTNLSESGAGTSATVHEEMRAVVQSDDIGNLGVVQGKKWPAGFAVQGFVRGLGPDVLQLDFPGVVLPSARPPFVAANWTKARKKKVHLGASILPPVQTNPDLDCALTAALEELR
jgi:hypothetical protein